MNLSFRFLLSPSTTRSHHQHTIHPYAHWFSHQRTNASLFRGITFPDVVPRLSPNLHLAEADFLSLTPPSPRTPSSGPTTMPFWLHDSSFVSTAGYDYIVTLFFIDTSPNAFSTIEHIHTLLRPGGMWINLGPLLWSGGAQAKVELSLEEMLRLTEEVGFIVEGPCNGGAIDASITYDGKLRRRTVECEYTGDATAMMKWVYKTEFWVARKSK